MFHVASLPVENSEPFFPTSYLLNASGDQSLPFTGFLSRYAYLLINIVLFCRYIVTQIIPEKSVSAAATFSDAAITKSIRNNVQKYYGDFGSGSINVGFRIKYCNEKTKVTIIRCRHGPHRFITSILPLMTVVCILF